MPSDRLLLLGAGTSMAVGMPSTQQITARILSGDGVVKESDDLYWIPEPAHAQDDLYAPERDRALGMIRLVRGICTAYYGEEARFVSYEDLYFVCRQVHDADCFPPEYDNPALQPLMQQLLRDGCNLLASDHRGFRREPWTLVEIASEALTYIHCIAWRMLRQSPSSLANLRWLSGVCTRRPVDIFTLNHDTVIEKLLREAGVAFVDGFDTQRGDVRLFEAPLYDAPAARIRLFKLHGSIDWFEFSGPEGEDLPRLGIASCGDAETARGQTGRFLRIGEGKPKMLIGTFNKMLEYGAGPFVELHSRLLASLGVAQVIVVVGYGFRDKGVNRAVVQWLFERRDRRLVVVHPRPNDLVAGARGVIQRHWEPLIQLGRLRVIEKYCEDLHPDDIEAAAAV